MNRKIVMIVDDESSTHIFLSEVLDLLELNIDFEILSVNTSEDAKNKIKERHGKVDLILLDLNLPDAFGFELYEYVRNNNCDTMFIFMSGYPYPEIIDDPNVYFLTKPLMYDDIENIMEKISKKWNI